MSFTANLSLPYIAPAQAQKHITHNEALKLLDALVHICVEGVINSLPANPAEGNCFIINAEENLPLASYNGHIVQYIDSAWVYFSPSSGWVAWQKDMQQILVYTNAAWLPLRQSDTAPFKHIGINTQPDSLHSLSVKGSRTLLDADTQGHRLKINKAETSETASLVFQNQYIGHAELGLTGDNKLHVKVSDDGQSYVTAMTVLPHDGCVQVHNGVRFQDSTSTLKHYEEGEWSPTLFGLQAVGALTYSAHHGEYTRIGRYVHASCRILWSSLGGAAGKVRIAGLPYQVKSGHHNRAAISISWYNSLNLDNGVTFIGGYADPNSTDIALWGADTPTHDSNNLLDVDNLTESGEIYLSLDYITGD